MKKRGIPVLIPVLILISMVFIGILIFTYIETKKANPKMIEVASRPAGKVIVCPTWDSTPTYQRV